MLVHSHCSNKFVINFEYNTPRFSIMDVQNLKIKRITIIPEESSGTEFLFSNKDVCLWGEDCQALFLFTDSFQFYELKIQTDNGKN